MTTKAEERYALDKIEKIIKGLGEDSYVAKAFEGCVEIAADNIANDFMNSLKESLQYVRENAERKTAELEKKIERFEECNERLAEEIDDLNGDVEVALDDARAWERRYNDQQEKIDSMDDELDRHIEIQKELKEQNAKLELEVIILKAKLYDLIAE